MDYDTAYAVADFIPDGPAFFDMWAEKAREYRAVENACGRARLNLPYGDHDREALDLFYPAGRPLGLVMFIHGGYWQRFDRTYWSHLAAGAVLRGYAVAVPSYVLAPEARISEITRQIGRALVFAADKVAGPVHLTGHSAGGHLSMRMMAADMGFDDALRDRITSVLPISPIADLRPLMKTSMNENLKLDMAEALRESPILRKDVVPVPLTCWVGADERPVFLEHAERVGKAWSWADVHVEPGRHHFDVIADLCLPDSPMMNRLLISREPKV